MEKRAREIANIIKKSKQVHIVSHIDADGITAGSIAYITLKRLGKKISIEFVKQLDEELIKRLKNNNHELVWFTDLGSSITGENLGFSIIVTDHHECPENSNKRFHLNPHLFNIDGGFEISGAGTTYLVSREVDEKNKDLSCLAIVGACGDLQDRKNGRLVGLNQVILKDGKETGVVDSKKDIRYFGRETRPVHKLLQYSNNPVIPGLSGRETACINFLEELGIRLKDGDNFRRWIDLTRDERRLIISNIAQILLFKGFGYSLTKKIIGEVYLLKNELEGSEVHEAKEFATLLNSTARYGKFDVGLNVCLGDRGDYFKEAKSLLQGHRANLVEGMQFAREEGITKRKYIQYFHAGAGIRDTIVGIVANMLLNSEDVSSDMPLLGFALKEDGNIKVSARGTEELVQRGLNLSIAMKKSASVFGGVGGGHNIAAGATIPQGREEKFLEIFENEIKKQLKN